jgi:hypothetical protein
MNKQQKILMNKAKERQRNEMILAGCYNKASGQVHTPKNKYRRKAKHKQNWVE